MRKIIPEKMVEIWTTQTILSMFGSSARVWAPTQGFDQAIEPVRGKRFLLELKAPDWTTGSPQPHGFPSPEASPGWPVPVEIDIGQLLEYCDSYETEVLYVLPQPAGFWSPTARGVMELEGADARETFRDWAYVVCSSQLLALISSDPKAQAMQPELQSGAQRLPAHRKSGGRYERKVMSKVVCLRSDATTGYCYRWDADPLLPVIEVVSLRQFLVWLGECIFDWPLVARSERLPPPDMDGRDIPEGLQPVEDLADPPPPGDEDRFDEPEPDDDGPDREPGLPLVVEIAM